MIGLLVAGALLLLAAAPTKLLRPRRTAAAIAAAGLPGGHRLARAGVVRAVGMSEIAVAVLVVAVGGRVSAVAVTAVFTLLAAMAWRLSRVAPGQDCGCFGVAATANTPVTLWHVGVDVALAGVGVVAIVRASGSVIEELPHQVLAGVPVLLASALLAWVLQLAMTQLPALLERRALVARGVR